MTPELEPLFGSARRLFHTASGNLNRGSLTALSESRLR